MKFLKTNHKRTIFLALLATITFVAAAIYMFDVETQVIVEFFVVSIAGLLFIIVLALLLTGLRLLVRRLFVD